MNREVEAQQQKLPVGPPVDATPADLPGAVVLSGRCGRVERLDAAHHGNDLWEAVRGHDHIWTYMAYGPFADSATFLAWLDERAQLKDPYYYAVLDMDGRARGVATLREMRPAMRAIEIGHIVFSPALQRTPLATEVQYLLARYVFETLRYRRYEWRCNSLNAASRRAASRLGFVFEGVFRQDMIVKSRSRDSAWFSMLDSEWPACRLAFERWLAPQNFDTENRQRVSLMQLRGSAP